MTRKKVVSAFLLSVRYEVYNMLSEPFLQIVGEAIGCGEFEAVNSRCFMSVP